MAELHYEIDELNSGRWQVRTLDSPEVVAVTYTIEEAVSWVKRNKGKCDLVRMKVTWPNRQRDRPQEERSFQRSDGEAAMQESQYEIHERDDGLYEVRTPGAEAPVTIKDTHDEAVAWVRTFERLDDED